MASYLDLWVGLDGLYKSIAIFRAVVQPSTSIRHVNRLQYAQATPHDGGVRKDENFPSLLRGMRLDRLDKPIELGIINMNFVTRMGRRSKPRCR
jgi:hypothetical protein